MVSRMYVSIISGASIGTDDEERRHVKSSEASRETTIRRDAALQNEAYSRSMSSQEGEAGSAGGEGGSGEGIESCCRQGEGGKRGKGNCRGEGEGSDRAGRIA